MQVAPSLENMSIIEKADYRKTSLQGGRIIIKRLLLSRKKPIYFEKI